MNLEERINSQSKWITKVKKELSLKILGISGGGVTFQDLIDAKILNYEIIGRKIITFGVDRESRKEWAAANTPNVKKVWLEDIKQYPNGRLLYLIRDIVNDTISGVPTIVWDSFNMNEVNVDKINSYRFYLGLYRGAEDVRVVFNKSVYANQVVNSIIDIISITYPK